MEVKNAELFSRFLAALIDGLIGWIFVVIPIIGGIISVLYLLLKDGLPYQIIKEEEWKNKSLGKKIMNIEVLNQKGQVVDLAISAKRNIPLAIGSFIAIIPFIGLILGPLVSFIFVAIELFLLLTDENNQRLGDRWANTRVIMQKKGTASDDTFNIK